MAKSSLDPIILNQQLIHVKAELDKYKKQVQMYRSSYPYIELENLQQELRELEEQNLYLNEKLTDLEEQIESYKKKLTVIKIKNNMYQSHLNQINIDYRYLQEKYKDLQIRNSRVCKICHNVQFYNLESEEHKIKNHNMNNSFEIELTNAPIDVVEQPSQNYVESIFHQVLIKNLLRWLNAIIHEKMRPKHFSARNQLILVLEEKVLKLENEINNMENRF